MICEVEVEVAVNNRSSERERANKDHKITYYLPATLWRLH
jgi:hypothetical protein